jgi:hypothetical protein
MKRGKIKAGWEYAGRECIILGNSLVVNGMEWSPIVFLDEEDPTWQKTSSVEELKINTTKPTT